MTKDRESTQTVHLVVQAQHGDRRAFDDVFGRYYDRTLRFVRRRVGGKLRRDLESRDILHESLAVAARKFPQFEMRDGSSLMSWLRAIVENQIRDKVTWQNAKRRERGREVDVEGGAGGEGAAVDSEASMPVDQLAQRERAQLVETYLARLDERYRELIVARDFDGLSWELIAVRTGRPSAAAARMMYNRALVELGLLIRRGEAPRDPE